MGRKRIYQHYSVPGSVVSVVQAMIQDYPRRQRLIDDNESLNDEWAHIHQIITDTINSYEPMLSSIILSDIINCRGYYSSKATIIASKSLYYSLKHKIIQEIATRCNLI